MRKVIITFLSLLVFMMLCAELMTQQTHYKRADLENAMAMADSLLLPAQENEQPMPADEKIYNLEIPRLMVSQPEQYIEHFAYTVSYNPEYNIPNWVAYCLEGNELDGNFSRTDKFLPDPLVEGDPVVTQDYSGSGFDRGHMAPAADMRWSEQAMKESFYMTNMCPQNHSNNAGDWKDLEELVRDIARKYGSTYICAGPIVSDASNTIGKTRKIVVPQAFFKVLLRQKADGTWTSIGFVMPNEAGNRPLMTYMLSVDDVEAISGIDFFPNLPDLIEETVESDFEVSDWTI